MREEEGGEEAAAAAEEEGRTELYLKIQTPSTPDPLVSKRIQSVSTLSDD